MDAQKEMPTISQGDFDLAVGQVTSFFQGKRAHLKKQVTHWYGKFMICKAENNAIRKKNRKLCLLVENLREMSTLRQIQIDKMEREVVALKQGVGA